MLSLLLTSADIIISRRFVSWPGPAIHMICPSRKSLICRTYVNSNCVKLWYGRRQRGGGGGGGGGGAGAPDLPLENYKFSFIFKQKKWYELPSRSNPPAPLELSGSAHACLTVELYFYFHFLHLAGLAFILSRANCLRGCAGWSAPLLFACNKVEFLAIRYIRNTQI